MLHMSNGHKAIDCPHSWYRRPTAHSGSPASENLEESAPIDEDPPAVNEEIPPVSVGLPSLGATPVENQPNTDDLDEIDSRVLNDTLASGATVPSAGGSSLPGASPGSGDASADLPVCLLDSQGFLLPQPEPADLPERPTGVLQSDVDPPSVSDGESLTVCLPIADHAVQGPSLSESSQPVIRPHSKPGRRKPAAPPGLSLQLNRKMT